MVTVHHPIETYPIHRVPATRPFIWLSQGWEDMLHHRAASMAYGAMVTVLGALILAYDRHPFYLAAITSAFLLVGPMTSPGSRTPFCGARSAKAPCATKIASIPVAFD